MKKIMWSLVTVGVTACVYYGVIHGVEWAGNIALFFVWAGAVAGTLTMATSAAKKAARDRGPSIPRWLSIASDFVAMCIFASAGMFWTAAAVLWQMACETSIYDLD